MILATASRAEIVVIMNKVEVAGKVLIVETLGISTGWTFHSGLDPSNVAENFKAFI